MPLRPGAERFLGRGRLSSGLLLVFLQQAPDGIGGLGASRDPILRAFDFERAVVIGFLRIVRADNLDELAVAGTAAIRHHHFVIGAILRSFSA